MTVKNNHTFEDIEFRTLHKKHQRTLPPPDPNILEKTLLPPQALHYVGGIKVPTNPGEKKLMVEKIGII